MRRPIHGIFDAANPQTRDRKDLFYKFFTEFVENCGKGEFLTGVMC
jgi:hypothetical protein